MLKQLKPVLVNLTNLTKINQNLESMKTLKKTVLALVAVSIMILATGCYGSFTLTKSVYKWNGKVTNDKFANSIVMWAMVIVPVYEFCAFVDFIVLNTVEFWTGSNPLTMNEGEQEMQIVQSGDKTFEITASKNQFHIEQTAGQGIGQTVDLVYKTTEGAWYVRNSEKEYKLAQGDLQNKNWVKVFYPDGKTEEITLN